jgi:hypothetical protein
MRLTSSIEDCSTPAVATRIPLVQWCRCCPVERVSLLPVPPCGSSPTLSNFMKRFLNLSTSSLSTSPQGISARVLAQGARLRRHEQHTIRAGDYVVEDLRAAAGLSSPSIVESGVVWFGGRHNGDGGQEMRVEAREWRRADEDCPGWLRMKSE